MNESLWDALRRYVGPRPTYNGDLVTCSIRRITTLYLCGIAIGLVGGFAIATLLWWLP